MLVRIIKNWSAPDLMRQTPKNSGSWEGIRFTCDPVKECDVVIVLNRVPDTESVICSQDNVWALMQEPYIPGVFEWMVEGHDQYKHVFTHCIKGKFKRNKYIQCQPALPCHVNKSYDELRKAKIPEKQFNVISRPQAQDGVSGASAILEYSDRCVRQGH